jgi:hypothetical protein
LYFFACRCTYNCFFLNTILFVLLLFILYNFVHLFTCIALCTCLCTIVHLYLHCPPCTILFSSDFGKDNFCVTTIRYVIRIKFKIRTKRSLHQVICEEWDFFEKNILMPYLTEKKFRFCFVAEIFFMLSPARNFVYGKMYFCSTW